VSGAYVTGAHSFKVGYTGFIQEQDNYNYTNTNDISYEFRNGVPQRLTMVGANPIRYRSKAFSQSAFVQEQWTLSRLTLQGAARYDYARSVYPHQTFGGSKFHPRILDFPTDTEGGITGFQNGLAIAGDYMSAASFLGISAQIFADGYDGLIYSTGFLVGWPIILFLLAERLRNLGRYTFADVASFRFAQPPVRMFAAFSTSSTPMRIDTAFFRVSIV
jgi:hypothetical protein